ncbi:ABC transporter permease subunit [Methylobacterium crusticola]|nr:ABC transporter permease subunit [Methylobacterium crusticola]
MPPHKADPASWLPLLAAGVAVAGLAGLPFLTLAPNRLVPGVPVGSGVMGAAVAAQALLAALLLARPSRGGRAGAALALAVAALLLLLLASGRGAAALLEGRPPAARAALGAGTWVAGLALAALAGEAARRTPLRGAGLLALAAGLALAWLGARAGLLDGLSLAVEYRARAGAVRAAIVQHLGLSGAALALALLVCAPLALLRLRGRAGGRLSDLLLNGVQVVPALALFAGLVSALSGLLALAPSLRGLGLAAIGPTPAVIGTAAYLALPLVRSLAAGLAAPDAAVLDAARAVGLTPAQTLLRVRLPLGGPVLLGGLRVAAVQSIGLSTLGGLVGAGGLGALVFEGMAQFAPDLILLGALPVIGLSLAAEYGLSALARAAAARVAGAPGADAAAGTDAATGTAGAPA